MTNEEAIKTIKCAISEVEWEYPIEYAAAFEKAIEALKKQITKKPIDGEFPTNLPDGTVVIKTVCPCCGSELLQWNAHHKICGCGQHLKWGD